VKAFKNANTLSSFFRCPARPSKTNKAGTSYLTQSSDQMLKYEKPKNEVTLDVLIKLQHLVVANYLGEVGEAAAGHLDGQTQELVQESCTANAEYSVHCDSQTPTSTS
jgi:hypothetical protein